MTLLEDLSKRYGKFVALDGLHLAVCPGETLALLGPNGAGKSTTIRDLVGLLRPSRGRALVSGVDAWKDPVRAKAQFGYVPDRPYLYGKLSGLELLRFAAGMHRLPQAKAEARIEELLVQFRLDHFASSLIETYSHGMRQKLSLAMSLLHAPQALILDEPMVGLDPHATRLVKDLLHDYSKDGRAVLLHYPPAPPGRAGRRSGSPGTPGQSTGPWFPQRTHPSTWLHRPGGVLPAPGRGCQPATAYLGLECSH